MAIGQGYIDVTPMQMAVMVSAVPNRGLMWQPYLVTKIVNSKDGLNVRETKPVRLAKFEVPEDVWEILENGLVDVVDSGTGYGAHIQGLKIAGKTGTAQNPHGKDHAWFAAYAPVGDPQLVLIVFVEQGGKGGSIAAPIARRILEKTFIKKEDGETKTLENKEKANIVNSSGAVAGNN